MRICIVTDAWLPQVNGVVRTLRTTVAHLPALGHQVMTITPDQFRTIACPGYPEIRLAVGQGRGVGEMLRDWAPDVVHIATEGPLGWAARRWCERQDVPSTTAFHTRFPDYLAVRSRLPSGLFWPFIKRFHSGSRAVLAATPSLVAELTERGFPNVRLWSRGVDLTLFGGARPISARFADLPRPIMLYVGRVAVEKNLPAFLDVETQGTKVIIGDGPALDDYRARYPDALFLGAKHGEELAQLYASADVFVFPSLTDTFGLVMIEALASGLPVAAYPIAGPLDIIGRDGQGSAYRSARMIGALDEDMATAIERALTCDRKDCVAFARNYDWQVSVGQFIAALDEAARSAKFPGAMALGSSEAANAA